VAGRGDLIQERTMPGDEDQWRQLIEGLRAGDRQAARMFWEQYGQALHRVAEKHLGAAVRRRIGPEDVVQSACRTFLRRAQGGEFQLPDSEALWSLLCVITLTKVREQTRYHLRQKRGLAQEVHGLGDAGDASDPALNAAAPGPTPAEAAEFADQLEQVLASLDEEERRVVDLKLQEYTHEEVAERLGCSERTVRRVFKRVQARLARAFDVR
jgi:RNA polymerase sigma factor (sigma-70 family)